GRLLLPVLAGAALLAGRRVAGLVRAPVPAAAAGSHPGRGRLHDHASQLPQRPERLHAVLPDPNPGPTALRPCHEVAGARRPPPPGSGSTPTSSGWAASTRPAAWSAPRPSAAPTGARAVTSRAWS